MKRAEYTFTYSAMADFVKVFFGVFWGYPIILFCHIHCPMSDQHICQVLPHVRDPVGALTILAQSLKPTGGIFLSLHSKWVEASQM